ncbi:MAG: ribosomal protein S18-alanine N-acetyltransferase [Acutalibacteraceae bacterium]|nr:ribosomal protein S18-alanine N-acetyltransferase [Acutalibacteraceae bacterium]
MNVLFVCTGNTCRSPMAEGYLLSKGLKDVNIISRGIAADGSPVSENAKAVMLEVGIDIGGHISAPLSAEDVKKADRIICFSPSHAAILEGAVKEKGKICLLNGGITDPYGGNTNIYRNCRDEIFSAIDELTATGYFNNFRIIPIEARHIAPIAKLEKVCFSEPWSAEGIVGAYKTGTRFFAAENSEHLMGYIGIKAVIDEGYITNVAVFPQYRNKGTATALIERVFEFARDSRLAFVSLEVRASNIPAITLYEKLGFKTEGRRRDFYRNPREDALIMTKRFEENEDTCNRKLM